MNDKNVARGEAREYGETDLNIHKVGGSGELDLLFEGLGDTLHGKFRLNHMNPYCCLGKNIHINFFFFLDSFYESFR